MCSGNLLQEIIKTSKEAGHGPSGDINFAITTYFESVIRSAVANRRAETILFSGEFMSGRPKNKIIEVMQRLNKSFDVEVKIFVRDPYEQFISGWKQTVKKGDASYLHEYLLNYIEQRDSAMKSAAMFLLSGLNVQPISYESSRHNLISSFISTIGVDLPHIDAPENSRGHNLSLSLPQSFLVVMATRILSNSKLSALLTSEFLKLANNPPDIYLFDLDKALRQHCHDDLRLVNSKLPEGSGYSLNPKNEAPRHSLNFPAADVEILMNCINNLYDHSKIVQAKQQHLDKGLPADFDPEDYLLRNPDVREAGVNPTEHYLNHGRFEGRRYKATPQKNEILQKELYPEDRTLAG
jgi:hypothetical protein